MITDRDRNLIHEVTYNMPTGRRTRTMFYESKPGTNIVMALASVRDILPFEAEIVGIEYHSNYDTFIRRLHKDHAVWSELYKTWLSDVVPETVQEFAPPIELMTMTIEQLIVHLNLTMDEIKRRTTP